MLAQSTGLIPHDSLLSLKEHYNNWILNVIESGMHAGEEKQKQNLIGFDRKIGLVN